ncbi:MAG: DUF924 domain-containing protein [cyanobacterium endosymbiont of Epithemia adnata isolate EadnSB Bon19]
MYLYFLSSYLTGDDPDSISTIEYTYHHLKVIERFVRFPHRNQILTRVSTADKVYFLQ